MTLTFALGVSTHVALASPTEASPSARAGTADAAPVAARRPHDVTVHGDRRIDEYFWLRQREDPEVLAHLRAEAAHTDRWFEPLQALSQRLYGEMVGRIAQTDEAPPVREGRWWYSTRTEAGRQYPIYIRRAAKGAARELDPSAASQVLLDLNALAEGRPFLSVGTAIPSPDGRWLAYTVDYTGARDYQLRIRDLRSGQDLAWTARGISSVVWSATSSHVFYTRQNEALRSNTAWVHDIRSAGGERQVFEETDELFNIGFSASDDRRFVVLTSSAKDTTEQWLIDAHRPTGAMVGVLPRQRGIEYAASPQGASLLLRINDKGPNYRLVEVALRPLDAGASGPLVQPQAVLEARDLVPHRIEASLEAVRVFRRHVVLQVREGGSVRLRVLEWATRRWRDIAFPESSYVAQVVNPWQPRGLNLEYDTDVVRVSYTSMVTPQTIYEATLDRPGIRLIKRQPVLGGFEPGQLQSRRLVARATDGVDVPVSVVYSRRLHARAAGAPQPLLLIGYGSYGIPSDPRFNASLLSLLDRGVIVAIAHIRGGGDLGRHWYRQGKLDRKMNTFTDFIAVAEHLVAQGLTEPSKLIINGGSAGGLLMGAVTNMRPDLFRAVVTEVPFVDVINTMLDETLPLTTEEFIEWGNPKVPEQYAWMRAYSPYDNLKPAAYPAILARTAYHDSQVPYWEAAKYVARVRPMQQGPHPVLLDINMNAGHGGASGRYDALRERARVYAFMLSQWGLTDPAPAQPTGGPASPAGARPARPSP